MTMADEVPDFERYFGTKLLSGVDVYIYEEANAPGKRKREDELCMPCHGMVLVAYSGYCRAKARVEPASRRHTVFQLSHDKPNGCRYDIAAPC